MAFVIGTGQPRKRHDFMTRGPGNRGVSDMVGTFKAGGGAGVARNLKADFVAALLPRDAELVADHGGALPGGCVLLRAYQVGSAGLG